MFMSSIMKPKFEITELWEEVKGWLEPDTLVYYRNDIKWKRVTFSYNKCTN